MGRKKLDSSNRSLLFTKRQNKIYVDMYRGIFNNKKITINYGTIELVNRSDALGYSSKKDKKERISQRDKKFYHLLEQNNDLYSVNDFSEREQQIKGLKQSINLKRPTKDYNNTAFLAFKAAFSSEAKYIFIQNDKVFSAVDANIYLFYNNILPNALKKAQEIPECSLLVQKILEYKSFIAPIIQPFLNKNKYSTNSTNALLDDTMFSISEINEAESKCISCNLEKILIEIKNNKNSYISDYKTKNNKYAFDILLDWIVKKEYIKHEDAISSNINENKTYIFNQIRYKKDFLISEKTHKSIIDKLQELNLELQKNKTNYALESLKIVHDIILSSKEMIDTETKNLIKEYAKQIIQEI